MHAPPTVGWEGRPNADLPARRVARMNEDEERVLHLILVTLDEGLQTGGDMKPSDVAQLASAYASIKGAAT